MAGGGIAADLTASKTSFKTTFRETFQARRMSRGSALPIVATTPSRPTHDVRFKVVIAFAARRICRHFNEAAAEEGVPSMRGRFDEGCFAWLRPYTKRQLRAPRSVSLWWAQCVSWCAPALAPDVADVCGFLTDFLDWCGLPPDMVVMAIVYLDKLMEVSLPNETGYLTSRSWRPLLATCLLIASKMWEDWCMHNFELADHTGFESHSLLSWELAAMNLLDWNASIGPAVAGPYFWTVHCVVEEAKVAGYSSARDLLCRFGSMKDLHSPYLSPPQGTLLSLDGIKQQVLRLPERLQAMFAFAPSLQERYDLLQSVGHGTYGEVRLAKCRFAETGQLRAVKEFQQKSESSMTSKHVMQSFVLSGIAGSMKHPNIVGYLEFVIDEGRFNTGAAEMSIVPVMEALYGPDLCDWLRMRQHAVQTGDCRWISRLDAANICSQVCNGLAYVHSLYPGLVHRDVKPENLKWAHGTAATQHSLPQADLRLVDFGTVYVANGSDTVAGDLVGTPLYMAPEVFVSGYLPHAAQDVFAVGVILFFLLSGHLPWPHRNGPIPSAGVDWSILPSDLMPLTRSLLDDEASKRPSALWLLEELHTLCQQTSVVD